MIYASALVLEEASRGDQEAAARRLDALADLPVLALNEQAEKIAKQLLEEQRYRWIALKMHSISP
ncbi:MAG: hypothetical protein R3F37_16225 [Candidatus Competibacteraceae bacterium]